MKYEELNEYILYSIMYKGKWIAYNETIEIIRKAGLNERNIIPGKAG